MNRVKKMVHYWCDDIKKAGLTGKGVTVAVLDTGLAPHPDFKSRVVGWRDCIYRKEKCYDFAFVNFYFPKQSCCCFHASFSFLTDNPVKSVFLI